MWVGSSCRFRDRDPGWGIGYLWVPPMGDTCPRFYFIQYRYIILLITIPFIIFFINDQSDLAVCEGYLRSFIQTMVRRGLLEGGESSGVNWGMHVSIDNSIHIKLLSNSYQSRRKANLKDEIQFLLDLINSATV